MSLSFLRFWKGRIARLRGSTRLAERYRSRRNLTIIHGDAHVWNCFMPRDGGEDVRLFDWGAWRIGLGTTDLDRKSVV